jgi:hypothetical protein
MIPTVFRGYCRKSWKNDNIIWGRVSVAEQVLIENMKF